MGKLGDDMAANTTCFSIWMAVEIMLLCDVWYGMVRLKNGGSVVAGGIALLLVSMAFWLSASAKNLQRGAEMGTQIVFTLPPERDRGTGSPRPPNAPDETPGFGLWRITTPTVVRSAATDASPEVVRLPVGAGLWPIEVGQTWSRVRGRAGTVVYTGYVRTSSMTRTDR